MSGEVSKAILELIDKDRKIQKNTEQKLDRRKYNTQVYKQLSILYDREIAEKEIKNKELLMEHGLLDKEHFIEFVRFRFINLKIEIVGTNNSISIYKMQELVDEYNYTSGNKTIYTFKNINIKNVAKSDVINEMTEDGKLSEVCVSFIKTILDKYKLSSELSMSSISSLVYTYLMSCKPKIPRHNVEQAIHLYNIQNSDENMDLNRTLKLLKSPKLPLDNLNFINEKKFMEYLYKELEKRPGRLKNIQYYMLETSMMYETKKTVLKVLNDIKNRHQNINMEEVIYHFFNPMIKIQDIFINSKLGSLFLELYPDCNTYSEILTSLNMIIEEWIRNLTMWENKGYLTIKDILDEIEVFPRFCNSSEYRNDYRVRKDFLKYQYQEFNKMISNGKQLLYQYECNKLQMEIMENIRHIILVEVGRQKNSI